MSTLRVFIELAKTAWSLVCAAVPAYLIVYALKASTFEPSMLFVGLLFLAGAALPWAKPEKDVSFYRRTVVTAISGLVMGVCMAIVATEIYTGGIVLPADCSKAPPRAAVGCAGVNALYLLIGKPGIALLFLAGAGLVFWAEYALFKARDKSA